MSRSWGFVLLACTMMACDTVHPRRPGDIVVQLFVQPDRPLPELRLTRTSPFGEPDHGVTDAEVLLTFARRTVTYEPVDQQGRWAPVGPADTVRAGSYFVLRIRVDGEEVTADGIVPPAIRDVDLTLSVPDRPVKAVLLDSLSLPLDSLRFELPSQTGYLYPVVARLEWDAPTTGEVGDWWMETRLVPVQRFSSALIDYFLRPEGVMPETRPSDGRLAWSGVYAVPVPAEDDPMPMHELRVVLIRGSADWAAYASSDGDPDRREPVSNVRGGLGIATGLAIDTLRIAIQ